MPGVTRMVQLDYAPAPPAVVEAIEEITVDSSIDAASALRMKLGIGQTDLGDWTVLEDDPFRPLAQVTVRVGVGELPVPEALINAYVTAQSVTYSDEPGTSTLEVSGLDALHLMGLEEKVTPWANQPDGTIAAQIFGQYGLVPRVQMTSPVLVEPEGTTIQRGTDLRFLRRLASRNGFDMYVQPEPFTGVDQGFFRPRQTLGAPQAVLNVHMGSETNVAGFRVRYDMTQPTGVIAAGLDTMTKAPQPALAPVSVQPPLGVEPSLTRVLPPPVVRPVDTGEMRTAELQALAQGIADRSSFAVVAEGEVGPDVGVLRPGGLVAVRGLGRLYNGLYLLTRVRHRISEDGYVQSFEARRNAVTMTGAEPYVAI
jgi:phage protein D